jgi:CDP-diacylglycerol---serine O-phosphatidyltransferase
MANNQNYLPLFKLLPNAITLLALCCGLTALKLALHGQFERAVIFIVICGFLDLLDGRFARLLNAQSKLGANLDSLCDFINFGLVPVLIMYLWSFKNVKVIGWGVVLIAAVCTCIRLARFNSEEEERGNHPVKNLFFAGIPAPAGGILIVAPILFSFDIFHTPIIFNTKILIFYTFIISLLMASTIPTISTKKAKIKQEFITPAMILIGIIFVLTFLYGWLILLIMCTIYLLLIPYSIIRYKMLLKQYNNNKDKIDYSSE